MPQSAEEIVWLHQLERLATDRFRGPQPQRTSLAKAYGGQLLGQALAAATQTVASGRPPHTAHAFFIKAADTRRPVDYVVENVHDGRSTSMRVVRGSQADRVVVRLMAAYQAPEPGLHHAMPPVDVPSPEDLPTLQDVLDTAGDLDADEWRDEWAALDIRYHTGRPIGTVGPGPGVQQIWVRIRGRLPDDPNLHRYLLAYLSDMALLSAALRPHGLLLGAPELPRATMNHSIWFHDEARADEWLLIDQRSPWAGGARGIAFGTVHTRDGRAAASLAQEGLIRPQGDLRSRLLERQLSDPAG